MGGGMGCSVRRWHEGADYTVANEKVQACEREGEALWRAAGVGVSGRRQQEHVTLR